MTRRIFMNCRLQKKISVAELLALFFLFFVSLVSLGAPWLAPYSTKVQSGKPFSKPSLSFLFGTDEVGRDVFSRVVMGLRSTWVSSVSIIIIGVIVGGLIGFVSGFFGGWLDKFFQRLTDLFLVLPSTMIAIAVVATLGPGLRNSVIAISIFWWPWYSRIVRSEVVAISQRPHLEAAKISGVSKSRLAMRYVLPGAAPAVLVTATLDFANVVLVTSLLSFLGLGAPAPAPELGAMTSQSLASLTTAWWIPVFPAIAVGLMCLASNLSGDGIRKLMESV